MNEIFTRRSIRKYNDEKITDEQLIHLAKAGMHAPSAHNQQPWQFYLINDAATIEALVPFSAYARPLETAKAAVVAAIKDGEYAFPSAIPMEMGAAVQNIMLEAKSMDIGSVWMLTYPADEHMQKIKDVIEMGNDTPFAIIGLGKHDVEGKMPPKDLDRYQFSTKK